MQRKPIHTWNAAVPAAAAIADSVVDADRADVAFAAAEVVAIDPATIARLAVR
jgi:hypothetical protein